VRRGRLLGEGTTWDALAGIASTLPGMLAVVVACLALLVAERFLAPPMAPSRDAALHREARVLKVEWPKPSAKNTAFAALIGGRVQTLDLTPVFERLLKRSKPRRPRPVDVAEPGLAIRFYPITNEAYCIQARPKEDFGETLEAARRPDSAWQAALRRFPPDRFTFLFWVTPDGFGEFRQLRDTLRKDHREVEWIPVPPSAPLEMCQGIDSGGALVPD